ncbi:hypothetical protein CAEBREN_05812 [Caenorhabditis brenneri]|uniref:Uncharacterized protein n=1 Tax=Caenorhabditis brenneri TaxID=135651 RepID=G0MKE8_CAEBE|nr:hypothetical protein CAEBREN_05812 [Caenorhabditis brenneri]
MGASTSSAYNKTPVSTPPRGPNSCLDPRSPSQDIERTPIQFNDNSASNPNNENNTCDPSDSSSKKEEKPRKMSLRQKMFERKKKEDVKEEKKE